MFNFLYQVIFFVIPKKLCAKKRPPFSGHGYEYELCWEKWVVMDSNHRRYNQQIYSLPHLATLVTTRSFIFSKAIAKVMLFSRSSKFFSVFFTFLAKFFLSAPM